MALVAIAVAVLLTEPESTWVWVRVVVALQPVSESPGSSAAMVQLRSGKAGSVIATADDWSAVYDATMKISNRYKLYHHFNAKAGNASIEAAVISAAYLTLAAYLGDAEIPNLTAPHSENALVLAKSHDESFVEMFLRLSRETKQKILYDNAQALFGIGARAGV